MIFARLDGASGGTAFDGDAARVTKNGAVIVDWTVGSSISGIPAGAGYKLEVNRAGTISSVDLAVGHIVVTAGQSNMRGWFTDTTTQVASVPSYRWNGSDWVAAPGVGSVAFAGALGASLGDVPIAFVDGAVGGTALLARTETSFGYWLKEGPGSLYQNTLNQLKAVGGVADLVLWMQGETEGSTQSVSAGEYAGALQSLLTKFQSDMGSPPVIIGGLAGSALFPAGFDAIRAGQVATADAMAGVEYVASSPTLELTDHVHLTGASRVWQAVDMAKAAAALLAGGSAATNSHAVSDPRTTGTNGADDFSFGSGNDVVRALEGDDRVDGGAGSDVISGGAGNDTLQGGADEDALYGDDGDDTICGDGGNDTLFGGRGDDSLHGGDGKDILDGGSGRNVLNGGAGDDTYTITTISDQSPNVDAVTTNRIIELAGEGYDIVNSAVSFTLDDNVEQLVLAGNTALDGTGNDGDNTILGNNAVNMISGLGGNDFIRGYAGNDVIYGGTGNDALYGDLGFDALFGGEGDDSYFSDGSDTITEEFDQGIDTVFTTASHTLALNVENLNLTGYLAVNGTGNDLANVIVGNVAANALYGGLGADTLMGGLGNDIYVVDDSVDRLIEKFGEGRDLVRASITWALASDFEDLTLTGSAAIDGTGNALANVLTGNGAANVLSGGGGGDTLQGGAGADTLAGDAGADNLLGGEDDDLLIGGADNDRLDGGLGADVMQGGFGVDTYAVDNVGDVVDETGGDGTDLVTSGIGFDLSDSARAVGAIENLTLTGSADVNGTGNALANVITGNTGANILSGGAGGDYLYGMAGNDTLYGDSGADLLSGGDGRDLLIGGADNDRLDGGLGADVMQGGLGNDTYTVDDAGDVIDETSGDGTDLINSTAGFDLSDKARSIGAIENLTLTGSLNVNGVGNAFANTITGNAGANVLSGGDGVDTLLGGAGDDILAGDGGKDFLTGGAGADTFMFGMAIAVNADRVLDFSSLSGDRLMFKAADYGLGMGNGLDATGRLSADFFEYKATASRSHATFLFNASTKELLWDADGAGSKAAVAVATFTVPTGMAPTDFLQASDIHFLMPRQVPAPVIALASDTGLSASDGVTRDAALTVAAEAGATLSYVVDGTAASTYDPSALADGAHSVSVTQTDAAGNVSQAATVSFVLDRAAPSVSISTSASQLAAGKTSELTFRFGEAVANFSVEDIVVDHGELSGLKALDDRTYTLLFTPHTHYAGPETVNVKAGSYHDLAGNAGGGAQVSFEIVAAPKSHIAGTVGDDTLRGTAAADAMYGDAGNDLLLGYAGNDILNGDAGNDQLDGGVGADTMRGGTGDDIYIVDNALDVVDESNGSGVADRILSSISFDLSDEARAIGSIELLFLTGTASVNGTGNALANKLSGNAGTNVLSGGGGDDNLYGLAGNDTLLGGDGNDRLDGGVGSDLMRGGLGNDIYDVDDSDDVVDESDDAVGVDLVNSSGSFALSANVENLTLTGVADIAGIGNALANRIIGNAGANALSGGDGADTLLGGVGNDVLRGDGGKDSLTGGAGADSFVFGQASVASADRVFDFSNAAGDKLMFSAADYGLSIGQGLDATGQLSTDYLEYRATASRSHETFLFNASTRELLWDADGAGNQAAIALASFTVPTGMAAADFIKSSDFLFLI